MLPSWYQVPTSAGPFDPDDHLEPDHLEPDSPPNPSDCHKFTLADL